MATNNLVWQDKYSVKVKLLDDQHRQMFTTINQLINIISGTPTTAQVNQIIADLIEYKKYHFTTEENYFDQFNYDLATEHKQKHRQFNQNLDQLVAKNPNDPISLAYDLIDFLEDWLIDHLMIEDQKYVACFQEHGLS